MKKYAFLGAFLVLGSCSAFPVYAKEAVQTAAAPACKETTAEFHAYIDKQRAAGDKIMIRTVDAPDMVQDFIAATVEIVGKPPFDPAKVALIELVSSDTMLLVVIRAVDAAGCTIKTLTTTTGVADKLFRASAGTGAALDLPYTLAAAPADAPAPFVIGGTAYREGIGCATRADVEKLLAENVTESEALGKIASHTTTAKCETGAGDVKLLAFEGPITVRGDTVFIVHFRRADGVEIYSWCLPEDTGLGV